MKKQIVFLALLLLIIPFVVFAQLPNCTANPSTIIYLKTAAGIENYDVTLPISATNPTLNTIPSGGGGLAVSNNLNNPLGPSPTFYTISGGNYAYWDGAAWVNTGHSAGPGGYVNPGGGGPYIYNYNAGGNISRYDGTGPAVVLLNVPGMGSGGPFDLVGDCDGGFYILRTDTTGGPSFMRKYDSTGVLQQSWTTTGTWSTAGVGFAIVNNTVYYHNGSGFRLAPLSAPNTNLNFTLVPNGASLILNDDFACCRVCNSLVPRPTAIFDVSQDTICEGDFVNLTDLSTDTPTVWNWTFPGGTPPTSILQNPSNVYFNTAGTYNIRLIASNAGGSDTAFRTLVVQPAPIASITGDSTICSGQSTVLSASPATGVTYLWSNNDTAASITVSPSATTVYSVIVSNGLCTDTAFITVDVIPQPVAIITGDIDICLGETTTLTANPTGISYLWSNSSTAGQITVSPNATTTFSVVVSNGSCIDSTSAIVSVNQLPTVTATSTLTNCDVDNGTATAVGSLGTPGYTYSWDNAASGATATDLGIGNYIVTVTDSRNCSATTNVNVAVHPNPTAVVTPYPTGNVRIGEGIQLNATGGIKYVWTPSTFLNCSECPNPISTPITEQINYCVEITDTNGCSDTACTTILIDTSCSAIFIPNAFTPNGDGLNDYIRITNSCPIDQLRFAIFNRWGQKVFVTNDASIKWDGTFKGEMQPTSTFYYYLDADLINGRKVIQRGDITLIR